MVGGSSALMFKILFLGALISMTGSKRMEILMHKPNKDMDYMIELFEAGKVTPVIDRRFPLREVPEAMSHFGSGKHVGKVVISMEDKKMIPFPSDPRISGMKEHLLRSLLQKY